MYDQLRGNLFFLFLFFCGNHVFSTNSKEIVAYKGLKNFDTDDDGGNVHQGMGLMMEMVYFPASNEFLK